jgi:pyruvate-formate lyase-activating enzyme
MFSPAEGDENSEEWLKIFSQEAGKEMTATLELVAGEEADDIDFAGLCEEFEALEKRVTVQSMHIQQIRLETWEGYQPKEQLEEAGNTPAGEMAEAKLSKGEAEQATQ